MLEQCVNVDNGLKNVAVFVFDDAIGGNQHLVDCCAFWQFCRKKVLSIHKFKIVLLCHDELLVIKFNLTKVCDVVFAIDNQVDLCTLFFRISFDYELGLCRGNAQYA